MARIHNTHVKLQQRQHLCWAEVKELQKYGIDIGSHTVTHPQLNYLRKSDIHDELEISKDTIEQKLGQRVYSFSYPFSFPDADKDFRAELRCILARCGYRYGVTTRIGTATMNDDIFFHNIYDYSLKAT